MMCKKPLVLRTSPLPFSCGQCLPCRVRKRKLWTHRMMLESFLHSECSFITLTYAPAKKPGQLVPKDLQDFLKRFRKALEPKKIRFYAVGEYGEKVNDDYTLNPHYHLIVFGYPSCEKFSTRFAKDGQTVTCCEVCKLVSRTWDRGRVTVDQFNRVTAEYTAGYVTKKMTKKDDVRLRGKHPEFARMSLRPGIGAGSMFEVARALLMDLDIDSALVDGDVPSGMMQQGRYIQFGRYLKEKLRAEFCFEETGTPREVLRNLALEMSGMYEAFSESYKKKNPTLRKMLMAQSISKISTLEWKYNQRKVKKI